MCWFGVFNSSTSPTVNRTHVLSDTVGAAFDRGDSLSILQSANEFLKHFVLE